MFRSPPGFRRALCAASCAFWVAAAAPVWAHDALDRTEPVPKQLAGVDVVEHLGQALPKNLAFSDESGKPVLFGDVFDGKLPVIVTMNYAKCPMLCGLQLPALVRGLKALDWSVGRDFRIVTVSFDPDESAELAHRTRARYLADYARPGAEAGWHFLHGSEANVRAVARALGIQYSFNEARQEYAHPAVIVLASPAGSISRYLYGIEFPKNTLHLSLVEASQGKIGTSVDRLILFCFHYDANEGRYAPVARNIMRVGGGATVLVLAGFLTALWHGDRKRKLARKATAELPRAPRDAEGGGEPS